MSLIIKKLQFFTFIIIPTFIILFLISCVDFTEPEPFVNNNIKAPKLKYKTANLRNYSADELVAGIIELNFHRDFPLEMADSIITYVNSTKIGKMYAEIREKSRMSNWEKMSIDTRKWENGKKDISFHVYFKQSYNDSLGVLGFFEDNRIIIYKTTLIFDNTINFVTNIKIDQIGKNVHISWSPTKNKNFVAYYIRKDGKQIAKIESPNISTFIDTTLPDFYKVYYEVGVTVGSETLYSAKFELSKGYAFDFEIDSAIDNLEDKIIIYEYYSKLISISTNTGNIINNSNFSSHRLIEGWTKCYNNDTFYAWDDYKIYTFDPSTLKLKTERAFFDTYGLGLGDIAVKEDKIYISPYLGGGKYNLYGFNKDISQFNCDNTSFLFDLGSCGKLSISPDGKSLLAIGGKRVKKFSIDNSTLAMELDKELSSEFSGMLVDWDNSLIFNLNQDNVVEAWDIQTLSLVRTFHIPKNGDDESIRAIFTNSNKLYIACNGKHLVEYNIKSGQEIRSWTFDSTISSLHGSDKGKYLFVNTNDYQWELWMVDIGGN